MLPQAKMVRRTIESMYDDICNIIEHQKVRQPDGSSGFADVTVHENVPCKLSFQSDDATNETDSATRQTKVIEVFLAPEIKVKAGSKLVITHLGDTTEFKNTGVPSVYETHQEIILDIFKGWS